MRQNDFDILQSFDPGRIPDKRNKTVVIDRAERIRKVGQGQHAFADQFRSDSPVFLSEIVDVHMAHISPEVRDRLLGVFLSLDNGRVHIPAGGQAVIGKLIEQVPQKRRIRIRTGGLHHHGNRLSADRVQNLPEYGNVLFRIRGQGMNAKAADSQIHRDFKALTEFPLKSGIREITYRTDAGKRQPLADQLPADARRTLRIGRARLPLKDRSLNIIKFNAVHARADGCAAEFLPAEGIPVLHGE